MTRLTLIPRATLAATVALAALAPTAAFAQEPTFGEPTAVAVLGEPITLRTTISGDDLVAVDVLVRLDETETDVVLQARQVEPAGTWQVQEEIDISTAGYCACIFEAPSPPNTSFDYQFRVTSGDGRVTLGPVGEAVVVDDRFEWRTFEQDLVRVHWYEGDDAFARSAAEVANSAIERAGELLGTTLPEPVDLFVYDTQQALLEAVSPNRENIAGQAHSSIDTMFVWIAGTDSPATAEEVIRHELTHLVFNEATQNDYHSPPTWLNEGVAVYLSAGYTPYWRSPVDAAVANNTLIPLPGLNGQFPSTPNGFLLGYGESVAAVDFFVRTHGEPKLWELVRSYAEGLSDDDAFTRATGGDLDDFSDAWFESLQLEPPEPAGPQPGQPGPEPPDWGGDEPQQPASPVPGASATPDATAPSSAAPGPSRAPDSTAEPGTNGTPPPVTNTGTADLTSAFVIVALIVLVIVAALVIMVVVRQSRAQQPPRSPR